VIFIFCSAGFDDDEDDDVGVVGVDAGAADGEGVAKPEAAFPN
jgi:hypothetical protein